MQEETFLKARPHLGQRLQVVFVERGALDLARGESGKVVSGTAGGWKSESRRGQEGQEAVGGRNGKEGQAGAESIKPPDNTTVPFTPFSLYL